MGLRIYQPVLFEAVFFLHAGATAQISCAGAFIVVAVVVYDPFQLVTLPPVVRRAGDVPPIPENRLGKLSYFNLGTNSFTGEWTW